MWDKVVDNFEHALLKTRYVKEGSDAMSYMRNEKILAGFLTEEENFLYI